jgi:hypothetical protein
MPDVDFDDAATLRAAFTASESPRPPISIAAAAQGRGGVLVIEGPPGIGKTRLLEEAMALADKTGVRTLFGEAFGYQQAVPFFSTVHGNFARGSARGDAEALRRSGSSADLRLRRVRAAAGLSRQRRSATSSSDRLVRELARHPCRTHKPGM